MNVTARLGFVSAYSLTALLKPPTLSMPRRFRLCVAVLCGLTLTVAVHGDWTRDATGFLVLWTFIAVAYLAILFTVGPIRESSPPLPKTDLRWALGALLSLRLVMAFGEPLMSDDVYRSVWEGRIQGAGGNPFAWSDRPEAEKWAELRDAHVFPRINHPDYAAIYPPAWQWAMRGVNAVWDSVTAVKLFLVACEGVFWMGLLALLRGRGIDESRVLIAAASPLALVEIAGSGHNEAMGMAALVWALVGLERNRRATAALALSVAILSKLIPLIVAFPWFRKLRRRDFCLMLLVGAGLSAFFIERTALLSLGKYGDLWRFNETLFAITAFVAGSHRGGLWTSAILLLVLGLVLLRRPQDAVTGGLWMSVALLLLMPNVLPWYALWLLVFLPAAPASPVAVGALVFTLTAPLAYLVYPDWLAGAAWRLPWPVRAIEYGLPVLAALASLRLRAVQRGRP